MSNPFSSLHRTREPSRPLSSIPVVMLLAWICAYAMQAEAQEPTNLLYPAPVRTFQAEGGYRLLQGRVADLAPEGDKEMSFYRVSYLGKLIDSRGEPFTSVEHVDLTVPEPKDDQGDRNDLVLRLEDAASELGGGLFEADGAHPLALRGLSQFNLRGAAYFASDLDGDRMKAAVGLESPPIRIPGFSRLRAANWLILGLMAERDDATDDANADENYGLVTGRLFIGKALGMRVRSDKDQIVRNIAAEFLKKAPTREAAVELQRQINANVAATQLSAMQSWLLDLVEFTDPAKDWETQVLAFTEGIGEAVSEQPTVSIYLEASGWYADKALPNEPRKRGLLTFTTDYWPLPARDDVIVRAGYEWGYQRLQPEVRVNQVTVSAVVKF